MNSLEVTFETSQSSFVSTQLNCFKYCYLTLAIQFNISYLFVQLNGYSTHR